ncbi:hypothetical protein PAPYR_1819 [Paratrimastix pyriformis]|uniref:Uncharacterized protein n=1 Tax=Paratrimastix pyriformis TaxID=342808 RepID=A0ABQ8UT41_9EUKA|nr:hypothetical protein PAPYR_1819 [Paratrimastix pyriformis]
MRKPRRERSIAGNMAGSSCHLLTSTIPKITHLPICINSHILVVFLLAMSILNQANARIGSTMRLAGRTWAHGHTDLRRARSMVRLGPSFLTYPFHRNRLHAAIERSPHTRLEHVSSCPQCGLLRVWQPLLAASHEYHHTPYAQRPRSGALPLHIGDDQRCAAIDAGSQSAVPREYLGPRGLPSGGNPRWSGPIVSIPSSFSRCAAIDIAEAAAVAAQRAGVRPVSRAEVPHHGVWHSVPIRDSAAPRPPRPASADEYHRQEVERRRTQSAIGTCFRREQTEQTSRCGSKPFLDTLQHLKVHL